MAKRKRKPAVIQQQQKGKVSAFEKALAPKGETQLAIEVAILRLCAEFAGTHKLPPEVVMAFATDIYMQSKTDLMIKFNDILVEMEKKKKENPDESPQTEERP